MRVRVSHVYVYEREKNHMASVENTIKHIEYKIFEEKRNDSSVLPVCMYVFEYERKNERDDYREKQTIKHRKRERAGHEDEHTNGYNIYIYIYVIIYILVYEKLLSETFFFSRFLHFVRFAYVFR